MNWSVIFLVVAVILFTLSALGVGSRIDFKAAGLAFFTASFLV